MPLPTEEHIFLGIFPLPLQWPNIRLGHLRKALSVVQRTGMRTKK